MFEPAIQFSQGDLLIGLALAAVVALAAWRLGALSGNGWVAATLVGGLTYGMGGLPAAALLIAFFASSSLLSKAFAKRKRRLAANFAKGGRRDWAQVAANGGMALSSLMAGAVGMVPVPLAWLAFAAALATVTADTWATELGVLSAKQPILATTGRRVPRGSSGGISLLGSATALAAALLIAVSAWSLGLTSIAALPLVGLAGLLGSFADSALGATVQAIYFCPKCKKETERHPVHYCGTQTTLHRGWRWLDNDWVNFLSSAFGVLLAVGLFTMLM
ncbi:MAG: DUF92 domain-containing protein [Chloroflexi bacterium]|nr:DUF92 domain-containing protein [Chloroflexota bacterium]